ASASCSNCAIKIGSARSSNYRSALRSYNNRSPASPRNRRPKTRASPSLSKTSRACAIWGRRICSRSTGPPPCNAKRRGPRESAGERWRRGRGGEGQNRGNAIADHPVDQDVSSDVAKELRETDSKIGEYVERKVTAENQLKRTDLRAPQDGIVFQSTANTVGG